MKTKRSAEIETDHFIMKFKVEKEIQQKSNELNTTNRKMYQEHLEKYKSSLV